MTAALYEILTDCPFCRVEAAVVNIYDPGHPVFAHGEPIDTRCRCCGRHRGVLGDQIQELAPAADLTDPGAARTALEAFAAGEGDADVDAFCLANMGMPADVVVARLCAHETVPTNFDVIAWLFPASSGSGRAAVVEAVGLTEGAPATAAPEAPSRAIPPMNPRLPARWLATAMLADGHASAQERGFLDAWLAKHEYLPLQPSDLRRWSVGELGIPPVAARDALLEAAVHLVYLAGPPDDAEWRVLMAFARAWGADDDAMAAWAAAYDAKYATFGDRVWRFLARGVGVR